MHEGAFTLNVYNFLRHPEKKFKFFFNLGSDGK